MTVPETTAQNDGLRLDSYTPEALLELWYQIGDLLRADGSYPFFQLEKGNTGYEVIALQTRLFELGYYEKEVVDYYGNGTYNALRAFEKAFGLTADGIASAEDQQALYSSEAAAPHKLVQYEHEQQRSRQQCSRRRFQRYAKQTVTVRILLSCGTGFPLR